MSGDVVAEARDLLAGITPGPWRAALLDGVVHDDGSSCYRGAVYPGGVPGPSPIFVTPGIDRRHAEFIAASPDLVARLVAEVERLRMESREWEYAAVENGKHLARLSDEVDLAERERDEALAVIERVRQVARDLRPSTLSGLLERALDDPS